jgi:hypothetical protein
MASGADKEAPRRDAEERRPGAAGASADESPMWRALLALESPATLDFDDPSLEWRRLFAEVLGTFLLVLAGAGAVVVGTVTGGVSRAAAVTVPGLTVRGRGGGPGGRHGGAGTLGVRRRGAR